MTFPTRWCRAVLGGLLATAALTSLPASAQDQAVNPNAPAEGRRSVFTFSLGGTHGRNLDLDPGVKDSSTWLQGGLSYAYMLTSRATDLTFSAAVNPQYEDGGDSALYPSAGLALTHTGARTRMSFNADYSQTRVSDQSIGYDDTGSVLTYAGSGRRNFRQASARIEGGIDMPFGYSLSARQSDVDYSDMEDTGDNAPTKTNSLALGLRADVSSMTRLTFDASQEKYDSEGTSETHRRTDDARLGLKQRVDGQTSLTASLGSARVRTERTNQPDKLSEGTVFGLGVTREDPLGSYSLGYNRNYTENGARDEFLFGRERETPLGAFSGRIGVSKGEDDGTDWIGDIGYRTTLSRQELTLNLARMVTTNDDGEDVVLTRISGNILHELSPVNALNFGLTASLSEAPDDETTRIDANVGYQHALNTQTSLEAGLRWGVSERTDREDAQMESVYLMLTRRFERLH